MSALLTTTIVVTAVCVGVMAGAFWTFSTFVMPGLRRIPAQAGVMAMQRINEWAPRGLVVPLFVALIGSVAIAIEAVVDLDDEGAPLLLAGAMLYLAAFAVTAVWHIPRNDALGQVDPEDADAERLWRKYDREWSPLNHVRTITCVASMTAYVVALATSL